MAEDMDNRSVSVTLEGRIDSENAARVERSILGSLAGHENAPVILEAEDLDYISSAGLRILLRIRKSHPEMKITGVKPEVYEILEMTGFVQLMTVEKAYRAISVDGCELIGEGANGKIYRIDRDNVVKVYKNADALSEIRHEREMARLALILDIPTAISYDVVRVGDYYGSVFELLQARSLSGIMAADPKKLSWCVEECVKLLHRLHHTAAPEGKLPSAKEKIQNELSQIRQGLPESSCTKLERMITDIPETGTVIHGDFHTRNVMQTDGEILLIDMDTLAEGHPVFELARIFMAYVGFAEADCEMVRSFQGLDTMLAREFWNRLLRAYLNLADEQAVTRAEDRIRCISYVCLLGWSTRHHDPENEKEQASAALWKKELLELLERVDSLAIPIPENH